VYMRSLGLSIGGSKAGARDDLIAVPPAAAPVPAPAATAIAASSAASSATLDLRTRFIHVQSPPADLIAVQRRNGFFSVLRARHLHETESARAPGIPVRHDADPVHLSVYLEELSQFIFRSVEVEVPNENVLHANCL